MIINLFNPFPRKILGSSNLKEFADNNFRFDENGRKLYKRVHLWEKEKLLIMSNFPFSHSVFKGLVLQTRKNQGLFGKGLRGLCYVTFEKKKSITMVSSEKIFSKYTIIVPFFFILADT